MDIPAALLGQIQQGRALLVLGAGASAGAIADSSATAPFGNGLRDLLCERFLGGQCKDLPLAQVGEYAISETSLYDVQACIRDTFEPFHPAPFHLLIPAFNWAGIATVNYDLVIERTYERAGRRTLKPFISDNQRINDLLREPQDRLLLKLHGCISRIDDERIPLILTTDQYVAHDSGRANVFSEFARLARENTVIFVGTTLQDMDLRQILVWLEQQGMSRPRGYLVTPSAPDVARRFWETKRITVLVGGFDAFLRQLDESITGMARGVAVALPALPVFAKLIVKPSALTEETRLALQHDYDYVHPAMAAAPADAPRFYKGFGQDWGPIQQGMDCPRRLTETVLMQAMLEIPAAGPHCFVIKAGAGAGKTVTLKRIAWEAAQQLQQFCLFLRSGAKLNADALIEVAHSTDLRVYVFVDDLADRTAEMRRLLRLAALRRTSITVIGAERANEWNVASAGLDVAIDDIYELKPLNLTEVRGLLDRLEQYGCPGSLAGLSRQDQEHRLLELAKGQLLVALHEALLGKKFEDIVVDEFNAVTPSKAQSLYLTVCLLNRSGTPVRAGLVSRVHDIAFDDFEREFFGPLEHVVYASLGRRDYDYEYRARHPYVAELVVRHVLQEPEKLLLLLKRIMGGMNLSYATDARAFRELTNYKLVSDLLPDAALVHSFYDRALELNPREGHVYLHRGLYEMWRPNSNLDAAAELIGKANELLPDHRIVKHAYAQLERARALRSSSSVAREAHRKHAVRLLQDIKSNAATTHGGISPSNAYPEATLAQIELDRLRDAMAEAKGPSDVVADRIDIADAAIERGLQQFPSDPFLLKLEAELASLLNDPGRAQMALEKAIQANIRNTAIVKRLADVYENEGEDEKAKALLEKAAAELPQDKRLNFRLARLLMRTNGTPEAIERHLRRSFTRGDKNYLAQLLYARQLYIDGKIPEAKEHFRQFNGAAVAPDARFRPTDTWLNPDGTPRVFSGEIIVAEFTFAKVRRDDGGDIVHVPQTVLDSFAERSLGVGDRVKIVIAFNLLGPIVVDLKPQAGVVTTQI